MIAEVRELARNGQTAAGVTSNTRQQKLISILVNSRVCYYTLHGYRSPCWLPLSLPPSGISPLKRLSRSCRLLYLPYQDDWWKSPPLPKASIIRGTWWGSN